MIHAFGEWAGEVDHTAVHITNEWEVSEMPVCQN